MRRSFAFGFMWRLIRLYSHLLASAAFLGICLVLLLRGIGPPGFGDSPPVDLDVELRNLELQVQRNRHELATIKRSLEEAERTKATSGTNDRVFKESKSAAELSGADRYDSSSMICTRDAPPLARCDYDISSIVRSVPFSNEDGGTWKQGWPIEYDATQWDPKNKLKVFVVPHSHNDPGWLKTFERYYLDQTKNILSSAVRKLSEYADLRFIWAEVSFFAKWFEEQPTDVKRNVTQIINEGRLEFVTGGWVMSDEANTHYYAMIEQLVLGHEWLVKHFPIAPKPRNGWAVDPFGLSPTMALLLRGFGLKNMVIQRVHYFLKKYLARAKALEFHWRQTWDLTGDTDMLCHLMPFYSYDVPHTCGPDPAICCQFDFMRLRPSRSSCPWRIPPVRITEANVARRAAMLLDQYRKKAQLYQSNSLLVPLGDDFRFERAQEWDNQYRNYKMLMDYINADDRLNAHIQFGTLEEYFQSLADDMRASAINMPTLMGDFFTYADKNEEYWSGYYTSRPFYKFLDRRVESTLRTAEIFYSLATATGMRCAQLPLALDEARKGLSLFQHHDGITGTAKTHVMQDYGARLQKAVSNSLGIIRISALHLLGNNATCEANLIINFNGTTEGYSSRIILDFQNVSSYRIALVNSLTMYRREIVSVYTLTPDVTVQGGVSQLSPTFDGCRVRSDLFELSFEVELRPFEIRAYTVSRGGRETAPSRASVTFYRTECDNGSGGVFQVSSSEDTNVKLTTSAVTATFSTRTGLLTRLTQNAGQASVELSFWKYSTPPAGPGIKQDRSGAYLFIPDRKTPTLLHFEPSTVVAVQGALVSEVLAITNDVTTVTRVKESSGVDAHAVEIHNIVDISRTTNFELMMRISTSIASSSFFTDLNGGISYVERRFERRLPVQANVYPMAAMAYLQDTLTRLTVASAQPLGVTDMGERGSLYVFLDRRLNQDDNRGLGQTITDNVPALSSFRLILESQSVVDPRPSLLAILVHHILLSPVLPSVVGSDACSKNKCTFGAAPENDEQHRPPDDWPFRSSYSTSSTLQPCGLHVVNLRYMGIEPQVYEKTHTINVEDHAGLHGDIDRAQYANDEPIEGESRYLLTLHNEAYSCSEQVPVGVCQITAAGFDITTLFGRRTFRGNAKFTSLSDMFPSEEPFHISENIHVPVNQLQAIKLYARLPIENTAFSSSTSSISF